MCPKNLTFPTSESTFGHFKYGRCKNHWRAKTKTVPKSVNKIEQIEAMLKEVEIPTFIKIRITLVERR